MKQGKNIGYLRYLKGENFNYVDDGGIVGIENGRHTIQIIKSITNDNVFSILVNNELTTQTREELAEFLWAAAYLLDSEKRHEPKGEIVGINYINHGGDHEL